MEKNDLAVEILQILQKRRRIRTAHHNHNYSIDPFIELVIPFLEENKPFKMLLPAFHCKSINPDSVLGTTPDGAEEEAIKNLEGICNEIQAIYGPGCELLILHEGHFYSDIKIVPPDDVIDVYEDCIHKMTKCPMIHFTNIMSDFSPSSYEKARKVIFEKHMISDEAVRLTVYEDQSIKNKFVAYKTFIEHEFASILMAGYTKQMIRKASKILAYQWLQRYLVFRKLCAEMFSDYFRLSVLAYPSKAKSFSINLIMNTSEYGLPWFHVLVKNRDGTMMLMKKSQAEKAGYTLIYKDNKPWYYANQL